MHCSVCRQTLVGVDCMCRQVLFAVQVINRFLSRFTGMTTDEIEVETDRDNFLGPQAAIDKGVIDKVLER